MSAISSNIMHNSKTQEIVFTKVGTEKNILNLQQRWTM